MQAFLNKQRLRATLPHKNGYKNKMTSHEEGNISAKRFLSFKTDSVSIICD
jgi:hypothetical protein